ncbi:alpha/beta fold hydrolase [uncultured Thiohalocapsa sp.]|uniref:esterase/lipase family protein n=1 Tax=uncultured Thiohalocapsa sp. TaxID=768990 RepID=UPI0025F1C15F|nr:alpha/beta fold hydrolase [uncultured Thiohalocapsa sp.]
MRFWPALCALALLALAGCQSAPPLQRGGAAGLDDAELAPALSASIHALADNRNRPGPWARSEAQHRRLLADNLPRLLDAAEPPQPPAADTPPDALLDPAELDRITPVLRTRAKPAGLARSGVGLPVVARLPAPQDPNAPRAGYHLPATLVAQPARPAPGDLGRNDPGGLAPAQTAPLPGVTAKPPTDPCCRAALVDPDAVQTLGTASATLPVAMDLDAPLRATRATGVRPTAAIANLMRPGRFTGEPRIVFLQPFDADKMPVVLVHGLLSTPGIWEPLVTRLLADPRLRDCCQLWFFYYPTGQPVPLSALQLRDALDDAAHETGLNRRMLLIGHSMGGILSRVQVSRLGPAQAQQILPGVADLSDYNRVRRALIFEPRTDVSRVVFLFVPHRGSQLAANGFGALAIRLIRLPDTLLNETEHALNQLAGAESRRLPTSIHGLSPRSPFLRTLSTTTPTVPVHSIIGNRGRGDGTRGSDGVVPVRSARLPVAESELIVPTGHGGFHHPDAVAEIKRIILLEDARQRAEDAGPPQG